MLFIYTEKTREFLLSSFRLFHTKKSSSKFCDFLKQKHREIYATSQKSEESIISLLIIVSVFTGKIRPVLFSLSQIHVPMTHRFPLTNIPTFLELPNLLHCEAPYRSPPTEISPDRSRMSYPTSASQSV